MGKIFWKEIENEGEVILENNWRVGGGAKYDLGLENIWKLKKTKLNNEHT